MANQKGNRYPIWTIAVDGTLVAYDAYAKRIPMSDVGFATDIGISVDGTVWVVSSETDPDGGGLKIFFSDGTKNWIEADGKGPGAIRVAGTSNGESVIITADFKLFSLNQKKEYTKLDDEVYEINFGGGYYWALKPVKSGGIPVLQFSKSISPTQWTVFEGNLSPTSISVDASGNCWALLDRVPYHFKVDGKTKKAVIPGASIDAIQISTKDFTNALLSATDVTDKGNLFLQYNSSPTTTPAYLPANGIRASRMKTTYYVP